MILRLLRGRVKVGEEAHLQRFVRDQAVAQALNIPGLISMQPAMRSTADGVELLVMSTWNGFEQLAAFGRDLDASVVLPDAQPMLAETHAEHYELVIGEARAMPLQQARLRLTRIPIRQNQEAAYYEAVRRWSDRLLDESGMVAFTLGRRVAHHQDEIMAVQVWADEAALREAAGSDVGRPMGEPELSRFWAADPVIEHFDALTAVEPRPNAPAIMLVDDDRRYVHATPAAALLSGHSLARLLTMRVEDVTRAADRDAVPEAWRRFVADGSMHGPFVLQRADGSEVEVTFAARTNTPWPGAHASLLMPAGGGDDLDIDRALVDAGLVARYATAATG
jgi:PAS domain-containing protein